MSMERPQVSATVTEPRAVCASLYYAVIKFIHFVFRMTMTMLRRFFSLANGVGTARSLARGIDGGPTAHVPVFVRVGLSRWYGTAHVSRDQAEERVLGVLKKNDKVDMQKLSLNTPFTQLGLDSLDVVEVMIALEDEFHLEIPDAVADKVQTPKEIAQYIYEFLNPQKSTSSSKTDHYSEEAEH